MGGPPRSSRRVGGHQRVREAPANRVRVVCLHDGTRLMSSPLKGAAKRVAQGTVGRLPRGEASRTGPLAVHGGTPVRNLRYRPWPSPPTGTLRQWLSTIGPAFRDIFLNGVEGLPQPRQKEFARRW